MLNNSNLFIFLLTILIEVSVAVIFGIKNKFLLLIIVLINIITNPALNYILWLNNHYGFFAITIVNLIILEIAVVLVECFLLAFALRRSFRSQLLLSAAINFTSFIFGVLFLK